MEKLLHIIASPREEQSRTLQVSEVFLKAFKENHPDCVVDELNLAKETIPNMSLKQLDGKYMLASGKDLSEEAKHEWKEIIRYIERFLSANIYVVSTPMWNFSIPYMLKQYIDVIVQPRHLFRYTDKGVEGLAKNKKMLVITSRGGEYTSKESLSLDFQEPYLRAIFGFVGITDITFINAQPMDKGEEKRKQKLKEAKLAAQQLAEKM